VLHQKLFQQFLYFLVIIDNKNMGFTTGIQALSPVKSMALADCGGV
jgi:hypothetical protein